MPLSTRPGLSPSTIASILGAFLVCTVHAQQQPSSPKLIMKGKGPVAVSRDGSYLTFINWDTGDLYVRDLKTGTDRAVTKKTPAQANESPGNAVISPDNQLIAYDWSTSTRSLRGPRVRRATAAYRRGRRSGLGAGLDS